MRSSEPNSSSSKQLTTKFMVRLMALCSKNVRRASKKLKALPTDIATKSQRFHLPTKSTFRTVKPKKMLKTISNKAMITLTHRKKKGESGGEEAFGDGGVWQKEIIMGDKCQPLDFSGVIYYDGNGKRVDEMPARSPRVSTSPLPPHLSEARKSDL